MAIAANEDVLRVLFSDEVGRLIDVLGNKDELLHDLLNDKAEQNSTDNHHYTVADIISWQQAYSPHHPLAILGSERVKHTLSLLEEIAQENNLQESKFGEIGRLYNDLSKQLLEAQSELIPSASSYSGGTGKQHTK